ncbi:MAG: hypothetical protein IT382_19680 [Deltaproteobacteria bacterium]|nr:hypothetical protein [Deltaproteobacteria bacterium]
MTAAANLHSAAEQRLDAVNLVAETIGGILASKAKDELAHLRWVACRAEGIEVFDLKDERGVPARLLVRAFALVGDAPVGGSFLADRDGVRLLSAEQLITMAGGGAARQWDHMPTTRMATLPREVLLAMRRQVPNVARAMEAVLSTCA